MVLSTTAAGTISQTARGFASFSTKSASDAAPTAFSFASASTAFGDMSKTTHSWPLLISRRTMFAPIRPSPIIPSCMMNSFVEWSANRAQRMASMPDGDAMPGTPSQLAVAADQRVGRAVVRELGLVRARRAPG